MNSELDFSNLSEDQLKKLKEKIEKMLTEKAEQALQENWSDDVKMRNYKDAIINNLQRLRTPGVIAADPGGQNVEPNLEEVFVELFVTKEDNLDDKTIEKELTEQNKIIYKNEDLSPEEVLKQYKEQYFRKRELSKPISIFSAIQNNKVVILGDPGSGKTTFNKLLAYYLAKNKYEKIPNLLGKIPIILYLRDCNEIIKDTLELTTHDFVKLIIEKSFEQLSGLKIPPTELLFNYYKEGNAVLIFDGLDEIGSKETRKAVSIYLDKILSETNCYILITSRPVGYFQNPINGKDVLHYSILGFNDDQKKEFINKWYVVTETQIGDNEFNRKRGENLAASLIEAVSKYDSLNSLAGNPLLITFMVFLHHHLAKMPDKRYQLYEEFVKVALSRWDRAKGLSPLTDPDKKAKILEPLAYHMHLNKKRDVTIDEISSYVGVNLSSVGVKNVKEFFNELFERNIIIIERGDSIYGFLHLSFQEYLCAKYLSSLSEGYQVLLYNLNDPWWNNVKYLYSAISDTTILVEAILNKKEDEIEKYLNKNIFDASDILMETNSISPETSKKVVRVLISLDENKSNNELSEATREKLITLAKNDLFREELETRFIALTKDSDVYVRGSAAKALGQIKSDRAIDSLIALTKDTGGGIRRDAIWALERINSDRAIDSLITLIKDLDGEVSNYAAEALGHNKSDRAIDSLIALTKDSDEYVRSFSALALRRINSDRAIDSLIALTKDSKEFVRNLSALALGQIKSDRAIDSLIALTKDTRGYIRSNAAEALGQIKSEGAVDSLIALTKDSELDVRRRAAEALGEIKSERAVDSLIALTKDSEFDVRWRAVKALGQIKSDRAIDSLIALTKDSDADVRGNAVEALGQTKSDRAIDSLIALTKDSDADVRSYAVEALGQIKSDRAIDSLIALTKDTKANVRGNSASALGQIKSDRAIDSLIALTKDSDAEVRRNAASALGQIKSDRAIDSLIALTKDTDVYVRRNAAEALGQIKSDRAIDSLIALIKDTDADVRKNARKSLLFLSNYDINRKLFDIISSPKPVFKNEAEKVLLVKYGIISEDSFKYY